MLTGVQIAVCGRPMLVQALCQLVETEDCRAFLDEYMASINFMPWSVDRESTEDRFIEDAMDGGDRLWAAHADSYRLIVSWQGWG